MDDLISRLSDLRSQYNCFDESERDAYDTLSEAIKVLSAQPELPMSPCDVCAYNTPLGMDGKPCPCSYCPAEPCRMEGEES